MLFNLLSMKLSLLTITLGHGTALISVATTEVFAGLQKLDRAQEEASLDLGANYWQTFWRVTVPVCLPSILQIARYLFVNGMTTVSAVAFLYSPDTQPASVAILNLDDAGQIGPAAAMATLVLVTAACACLLFAGVSHGVLRRTQAWRTARRG